MNPVYGKAIWEMAAEPVRRVAAKARAGDCSARFSLTAMVESLLPVRQCLAASPSLNADEILDEVSQEFMALQRLSKEGATA